MIRDGKAFTGVLTRIGSKAIEENVVLSFNIKHLEEGELQTFLNSYQDKCKQQNIKNLFNFPVNWKSINIEANYRFRVEFDEIEFIADLKAIKVKRTYKNATETFQYDLEFQKPMEKDSDLFLSTYLNQKEENENSKKVLIQYSTYLHPLESVSEGITPEMMEE